mgnify:CR=1 FL=1
MVLPNQTVEEKVLSTKIMELEDKIVSSGKYINAITEDCFNGIKVIDGKEISQTPTEQATEIVEVAKEVQKMAIQYELLIDLDNQIEHNKKAVNSSKFGDWITDND